MKIIVYMNAHSNRELVGPPTQASSTFYYYYYYYAGYPPARPSCQTRKSQEKTSHNMMVVNNPSLPNTDSFLDSDRDTTVLNLSM